MKKLLLLCAALLALQVHAQTPPDLTIENRLIGSGEQMVPQNAPRFTNAKPVGDYGVYHAPQFLPYYPTAAVLWPRVREVKCKGTVCEGYDWKPDDGRGEYVYIRPVQVVTVVTPPVAVPLAAPVPMPDKKINE